MAHDRMMRAEMRYSEKVNSWPIPVRFFFSQLWGACDDYGRGRYDARVVKADTFPIDDEVTVAMVGRWLKALEVAGVLVPYESGGKQYFYLPGWDDPLEGQTLRYKKKSNIPEPPGALRNSPKSFANLPNSAHEGEGEREGERDTEGEKESTARGAPPPLGCPKHPQGTDKPCRPCGDARRSYEAWERAQKNKPTTSGIITEPDCPKHPHRPLRGCDRCAEEALQK